MWGFDALVYLGLLFVALSFGLAGWVLLRIPANFDQDIQKIRFSAVTFSGIMILFIFLSILFVANPTSEAAEQVFEKGVTAMTPLAGAVIGYLFGSRGGSKPG